MKDFEGFKRIKNTNNYTIDYLYQKLYSFENATGKITKSGDQLIIDVDGKYFIEISINKQNQIIIQRKIEDDYADENIELGNTLKSIDMSKADRMIEQIYDLIISIDENDNINEPITSVKKIYYVKQYQSAFKNIFHFNDENGNTIFEAKEHKLLQEFKIKNKITKMNSANVKYTGIELGKYSILINSYNNISIVADRSHTKTVKNLLSGTLNTKELLISADYTDNHYIIEYNKIVIGAIDSLNDKTKDSYRIEINSNDYENLILALTIIIDLNFGK